MAIHTILIHIRSYSAHKIRGGDDGLVWQRAHNLNKISLQSGFFQKEKMTAIQFTNIVNFACFVGDFDWAHLFMEQHSHLLESQHYDNALLLSNGLLLSSQKKSRATLDLLEQTNFNDVHLSMRARSLIIKSLYELQEPAERILSNCSAFNAFLSRNQKSHSSSVKSSQNFVKIVKMMANGKKDKADITDAINATKPLFFKKWLLEMNGR